MIVSSSIRENIQTVIFKDYGVVCFNQNTSEFFTLSNSLHVEEFNELNKNKSEREISGLFLKINNEFDKLHISSLESISLEKYIDEGKYFYGDIILLSNGVAVWIDDNGVSVHQDKEEMFNSLRGNENSAMKARYFSFEAFVTEYSQLLSVEAKRIAGKYSVVQSTGTTKINPFHLYPEMINFTDLATSLSGINRFAGQTPKLYGKESEFYTVGQHCIAGYNYIKNHPTFEEFETMSDDEKLNYPLYEDFCGMDYEQKLHLAHLFSMHEFYEAITGIDMIKPFKNADENGSYPTAEKKGEKLMEMIIGEACMTPLLKKVDNLMAAVEGKELVGWDHPGIVQANKNILFMPDGVLDIQKTVKQQLLKIWNESGIIKAVDNTIEKRKEFKHNNLHVKMIEKIKATNPEAEAQIAKLVSPELCIQAEA
jgi:hypothetical protein